MYFRLQGLQIGVFQQRYLKCKCETPYFGSELVPNIIKIGTYYVNKVKYNHPG